MSPSGRLYPPEELLPAAWATLADAGPVRVFNPALLPQGNGWLFAYRVVAGDGQRRIALCRLDAALNVVPGSPTPLSDCLRLRSGTAYPEIAHRWFADPRLYQLGDRVYVYWNSGWHEPRNHQFVQELNPRTLEPLGVAHELCVAGFERQKLEKNWTLFSLGTNQVFAVYSLTPHRVLVAAAPVEGDWVFTEMGTHALALPDYPACHGGLRGGTPPVRLDREFLVIGHSVHDGPEGYTYAAAALTFAARPPFTPKRRPVRPLPLYNPRGGQRQFPALNPAVGEVLYPCGLAWTGERWLVAHGINDEQCAITFLPADAIDCILAPVSQG